MVFDVIIGRSKQDVEKYGKEGTILLGKQYVKLGQTTSLSNPVYLDIASAHVMFIVGKRGAGKSYTLGSIAEGLATLPLEIRQNLSIILVDTMGIYWTMKFPNLQDTELLREWELEPKPLDVKIYTPSGYYSAYKEEGIPTDFPFSIRAIDINATEWCKAFDIKENSAEGVLLTKVISQLQEKNISYDLDELILTVRNSPESELVVKNIVINELIKAKSWKIFSKQGTPLLDLAVPGQVTILDISSYATMPSGWEIKALVVGLICRSLFNQRMNARRVEEFKTLDSAMHYFTKQTEIKLAQPLVWLAIDEAHELLPKDKETAATESLVTILREGRQPGISLILASQQPEKIHTDVMTQADTVLAHRLTAKIDVDALGALVQSYMRRGLDEELNLLPRIKGAAVIFDDSNERIFPIQVKPRISWHGGSAPTAIREKKELFNHRFKELSID